MVKKLLRGLSLALIFMISTPLFAVEVPALKGRVNDYAKIIRDSDEREIEQYLETLERNSGIQIAVLTMPSLEGDNISSFGIRVADKWKIGNKEKDNGALLIVAYAEHDLRIEVGDGLEGSLTDAKCGLILRNVIIPEFKNGNYSEGIKKGVMNMGGIASGDESAVSKSVLNDNSEYEDAAGLFMGIVFWIIFFIVVIVKRAKRGGRRGRYYHNGNLFTWIAADAALRTLTGSGSGRSGGLHSSGGFGGFSGGGGHFSGGGASAHW